MGACAGIYHYVGDSLARPCRGRTTDLCPLVRGETGADILTIVAIDDDMAAKKGGYPLPRSELARLVEEVARFEPRVIALDMLLVDRGSEAGDAALLRALKKRPTVIAAAGVFPDAIQSVDANENGALARLPRAERFLLPLKAFAYQAASGVVNLTADTSGTPRRPLLFRRPTRLNCRSRYAADTEGAEPAIQFDGLLLESGIFRPIPITSFYGRRGTVRTVSAVALLNGEVPPAHYRWHYRGDRYRRRRHVFHPVRPGYAGRGDRRDRHRPPDDR